MGVDVQTALGVKQGTGDFDRAKRPAKRLPRPYAPKGILALYRACGMGVTQTAGRKTAFFVKRIQCISPDQRALAFGIFEIRKLAGYRGDTGIKDRPSIALRLAQDGARGFGIALRFVPKALACDVDLKSACSDNRPSDQNAMRVGDFAVSLIRAQMPRGRAKLFTP